MFVSTNINEYTYVTCLILRLSFSRRTVTVFRLVCDHGPSSPEYHVLQCMWIDGQSVAPFTNMV